MGCSADKRIVTCARTMRLVCVGWACVVEERLPDGLSGLSAWVRCATTKSVVDLRTGRGQEELEACDTTRQPRRNVGEAPDKLWVNYTVPG